MTHLLCETKYKKESLSASAWEAIQLSHSLEVESQRGRSSSVSSVIKNLPLEEVASDASTQSSDRSAKPDEFVNNCSHFVKKYTPLQPEIYLVVKLSWMHFKELLEYINQTVLMFILDTLGFLDIL